MVNYQDMAEIGRSKYYYDYFRNMSEEQIKHHCGRPTCEKEFCICCKGLAECPNEVCECIDNDGPGPTLEAWRESLDNIKSDEQNGFDAWIEDLEDEDFLKKENCLVEEGECHPDQICDC